MEYVYNCPWSLKTYDGREKSLLRGATRDLLPTSVAERVKSPYPSTQDARYVVALQEQGRALLADPTHEVFELINKDWLKDAVARDAGDVKQSHRRGLERALDLSIWLDAYSPAIKV